MVVNKRFDRLFEAEGGLRIGLKKEIIHDPRDMECNVTTI